MCSTCTGIVLEHAVAVAERELIFAEADDGASFPGATRPLTANERRAKTRFGDIDALEERTVAASSAALDELGAVISAAIVAEAFGDQDEIEPAAMSAAVTRLNEAQPEQVTKSTAKVQATILAALSAAYVGASTMVRDEAKRQGAKVSGAAKLADPKKFEPLAQATALYPWTRLTGKVQATATDPQTLMKPAIARADVEKTLAETPLDGAYDLARQSAHAAQGAGRIETAEELDPQEIYSSELLDGATCGPCARVDGKDYETMADAKTEYETGGYGACAGGARCRGTLIFMFPVGGQPRRPGPEPDPEPTPPPAPKTPRRRATPKPKVAPTPAPESTPAPEPAAPGAPPAPTGTPPKRRKGTSQRYEAIDQLPVDAGRKSDPPLLVARDTNPGYAASGGQDKNYSNNCSSVVSAYEMQRRGYDVRAAPVKGGKGRYDNEYVSAWWTNQDGTPAVPTYAFTLPKPQALQVDGKKVLPNSSIEAKAKLDEFIGAMPDGARGLVTLHWTRGGGHTFSWEKVDGKPVYLEGQTGKADAAGHLAPGKFDPRSLRVVRLDDKVPTNLVTTALETRPAELAAEVAEAAAKKAANPTAAQKKKMSYTYTRQRQDGTTELIPPYWRANLQTRQYEPVPEPERQKLIAEWDEDQKRRAELRRNAGRR